MGHRNGYRLTAHKGRVYATDTGWYTIEEVNHVQQGHNYGWPCMEGPDRAGEYKDQAGWAAACTTDGTTLKNFTPPVVWYAHPIPAPPGNVMSVSAVGGNIINDRLYYGDFTQGWIKSVRDSDYQDERLEADNAFPVDIKMTPQGEARGLAQF